MLQVVHPTPPILRGLKATVDALTLAGHFVAPFPLPADHARGPEILNDFFLADGGENIKAFIADGAEPWPAGMRQYAEREAPFGATRMWELQAERNAFNKRVSPPRHRPTRSTKSADHSTRPPAPQLSDHWNATASLTPDGRPFDVILSPATAYGASLAQGAA
jgi:amidase